MIRKAEQESSVDANKSYSDGEKIREVEFGRRAGCKTVLLLTGYGKGELEHNREQLDGDPDHVAADILDAAKWIVSDLEARERNQA